MLPEQLPLGPTVAVVVANVLVTVWLLWVVRSRVSKDASGDDVASADATPSVDERHDAPAPDDIDVIQCSICGVENDADYRYCRFCVAELRGATTVANAAENSMGRLS